MFRRCLDPYGRCIFIHVGSSYEFVPVAGLYTVLQGPLLVKWHIIRFHLVNITRWCLHGPHRALYGPVRLIIRIFPDPFRASGRARTVLAYIIVFPSSYEIHREPIESQNACNKIIACGCYMDFQRATDPGFNR